MTATAAPIPLGRLMMTRGVCELVRQQPAASLALPAWIRRHARNDCPNLSADDRAANAWAIEAGERVLTSWTLPLRSGDVTIWLITEADRSATTVLLPSEY